jgi:3'-phosphoadenosine 5'-phosphosulfate sulfotransferase (PAPS reductase)/FAD synthetase
METKDAAGNTPKPLTIFEKKWRESVSSGDVKDRMEELKRLQDLPLDEKIAITEERIRCWYESFEGKVAVSFSGGKDSKVLLWIVRRLFPDVPAVFCNTGLEYPEVIKHVMSHENVTVMRPLMPFHQVIEKYGYPLVSKKVARGISILRNPTDKNQNVYRLYDEGINRFGEQVNGFKIAARWRFLIDAPFECSDKCCEIMKKEPMRRYTKQTGRKSFVGTMAADSKAREKVYLQHGCNGYDLKDPKSTPLGFWTEQDILQALVKYKLTYPSVYGQIRRNDGAGGGYT